jgi:hypothetical protein
VAENGNEAAMEQKQQNNAERKLLKRRNESEPQLTDFRLWLSVRYRSAKCLKK